MCILHTMPEPPAPSTALTDSCKDCTLRGLRMFCNLTPEALKDYDGIGIMMNHARGAKLFSEGDTARNVLVICCGQVKISSTSRDGKTMILKIAAPGDVMGLSAVLANVPHEVTAEAIEPCQVKAVRKQEFVDFLGRHGIASMHAAQSLSSEYMTVFHDEAPKLFWRHVARIPELSIEIGQIRKSSLSRNHADGIIRIHQKHAGPPDPQPSQIFADVFSKVTCEQPMQRARREVRRRA